MSLDLKAHHRDLVERILAEHVSHAVVYVFGSRARGKAKPHSDLDLMVRASLPLDTQTSAALYGAFEDSALPFQVDVLDWFTTEERFRARIAPDFIIVSEPGALPESDGCADDTAVC